MYIHSYIKTIMKKFLLSFFLIFASGAYALSQHKGNAQEYIADLPPSPNTVKNTAGVSPSGSSSYLKTKSNTSTTTTKPAATSRTQVSAPVSAPAPVPAPKPRGMYNDGTYTGSVADAYYGNIEVQAIIQNGKLADVTFLQYPNDRDTSRYINSQAMPLLKSEAIAAQSANVDIISGATDSSQAFQESLGVALTHARI